MKNSISRSRYIASVAVLSAVSTVLMMLDFPIPALIPSFVKLDFSEMPALLGSFALGPSAGVLICLFKNLLHLPITTTGCIGELANFLIGVLFVVPAGLIYKRKKTRGIALIACLVGAIIMAIGSIPVNMFISYPFYYKLMPKEAIISAYQAIFPSVKSIEECLVIFNMPFTFVKGIFDAAITFLIYKPLAHILKAPSKKNNNKEPIKETPIDNN